METNLGARNHLWSGCRHEHPPESCQDDTEEPRPSPAGPVVYPWKQHQILHPPGHFAIGKDQATLN